MFSSTLNAVFLSDINYFVFQWKPDMYDQNYSNFVRSVHVPPYQHIELSDNMFDFLPNLMDFNVSGNYIEYMPSSLHTCKHLTSLVVRETNLTGLPDSLLECKNLKILDISGNLMETFPSILTRMTKLQEFKAVNMFWRTLPEDIDNLTKLKKLNLDGNCFTQLPASFAKLKSLKDLSISGVPWFHLRGSDHVSVFNTIFFFFVLMLYLLVKNCVRIDAVDSVQLKY